ncbi:hypothetical protein EMIT013CA1_10011 [Bacillus sp. IT-13CA1]
MGGADIVYTFAISMEETGEGIFKKKKILSSVSPLSFQETPIMYN